jgi:hypothetical protein
MPTNDEKPNRASFRYTGNGLKSILVIFGMPTHDKKPNRASFRYTGNDINSILVISRMPKD